MAKKKGYEVKPAPAWGPAQGAVSIPDAPPQIPPVATGPGDYAWAPGAGWAYNAPYAAPAAPVTAPVTPTVPAESAWQAVAPRYGGAWAPEISQARTAPMRPAEMIRMGLPVRNRWIGLPGAWMGQRYYDYLRQQAAAWAAAAEEAEAEKAPAATTGGGGGVAAAPAKEPAPQNVYGVTQFPTPVATGPASYVGTGQRGGGQTSWGQPAPVAAPTAAAAVAPSAGYAPWEYQPYNPYPYYGYYSPYVPYVPGAGYGYAPGGGTGGGTAGRR